MIDLPKPIKEKVKNFTELDWEAVEAAAIAFCIEHQMDPVVAQGIAIARIADEHRKLKSISLH
jgi:hypothetical protein